MAEILPGETKVAQLSGYQSSPQHTVQLHPHFLRAAAGGALEGSVVADGENRIFREIVQGGGHLGVNKGHIPVGGGIIQAVFVFLQIPGQGGDERFIHVFPTLLTGNQRGDIPAQALDPTGVKTGQGLTDRQNGDAIAVISAALGGDIEITHGVQLVSEELRPDGLIGGRGEDI